MSVTHLPAGYRPVRRDPLALESFLEPLADWFAAEAWQDQAACSGTDAESFFPEKGGSTLMAKRVCATCPVRAQCLESALERGERFGVWGGMSERERRKITKRRERLAVAA